MLRHIPRICQGIFQEYVKAYSKHILKLFFINSDLSLIIKLALLIYSLLKSFYNHTRLSTSKWSSSTTLCEFPYPLLNSFYDLFRGLRYMHKNYFMLSICIKLWRTFIYICYIYTTWVSIFPFSNSFIYLGLRYMQM